MLLTMYFNVLNNIIDIKLSYKLIQHVQSLKLIEILLIII